MKAASTDQRQHILQVAKPLILAKSFTAVGLAELLAAAAVPKGSFYHYFASKEAFGEALLEWYFADHLAQLDALLAPPASGKEKLMRYWRYWLDTQTNDNLDDKCLAVKLSAEVCDLSEAMRMTLDRGTQNVIARLAACVEAAQADGSLSTAMAPAALARLLYHSWLGASLLAKVSRTRASLDAAMEATVHLLGSGAKP
jgi:TetR/AcrR family transcriptional repressor of nem operon